MPDELEILRKASEGLLYPSESDVPFDPVRFATQSDITRSRPFQEQSLDDFFRELLTTEDADRYRALRQTLESLLKNPKVLRMGARTIDVYIIGQTPRGDFAGLHTQSIET
jgi:7,8-dihydro-6-hydroxymethylpterin-pyrophosphokinase